MTDVTESAFSPVDNDPPLGWQRKLRLAPAEGFGVARRAALFAAIAWLPAAIWAALTHRLWEGAPGESLLLHFGVHVRCLIAIPLFVVAEATVHKGLSRLTRQFTESGIVVAKGGVLGLGKTLELSGNYDESRFTTLDTDAETVVRAPSAKVQVLSPQPTSSYELRIEGDQVELHILDPVEFRKIKHLVIMTA